MTFVCGSRIYYSHTLIHRCYTKTSQAKQFEHLLGTNSITESEPYIDTSRNLVTWQCDPKQKIYRIS